MSCVRARKMHACGLPSAQVRIAVLASGKGSNFSAIAEAVAKGAVPARLSLVICDNPEAGVIARAKKAGVPACIIDRAHFGSKREFEAEIISVLKAHRIALVVLAGFMRLLGPQVVRAFRGRIINIHPALLPAFKGGAGIKDAFDYGVKVTGVTVHVVDEEMDHGPIIMQEALAVEEDDTVASLEAKVHAVEHRLYPKAIELWCRKKARIVGRKVRITSP